MTATYEDYLWRLEMEGAVVEYLQESYNMHK